jgi:hypothetical protein
VWEFAAGCRWVQIETKTSLFPCEKHPGLIEWWPTKNKVSEVDRSPERKKID